MNIHRTLKIITSYYYINNIL